MCLSEMKVYDFRRKITLSLRTIPLIAGRQISPSRRYHITPFQNAMDALPRGPNSEYIIFFNPAQAGCS